MSAIILKIGGSLTESEAAAQLIRGLAARRPQKLLIVPGGGEFADAVRAAQSRHGLDEGTAHHMALLAMQMVGMILANLAPGFVLAETVDEFASVWQRRLTPVWAPARMVLAATGIRASWDVTSDSLSAWLAGQIGAARLVVAKSCAVPPTIANNARELAAAGLVDAGFPEFVVGRGFSWHVVSGADEAIRVVCS
jgi:dihydroneopterin aldolase